MKVRSGLFALALGLIGGTALLHHANARDIPVLPIGDELIDAFQRAPVAEAKKFLVGYTTLVDLGAAPELEAALPFAGRAIVYFPDVQTVLVWAETSSRIESGHWFINGRDGLNELCLVFEGPKNAASCTDLEAESDLLIESTPGNPFGFVAGAGAPHGLLTPDTTLSNFPVVSTSQPVVATQ